MKNYVIYYVHVGQMAPEAVSEYLETVRQSPDVKLLNKAYRVVLVPVRDPAAVRIETLPFLKEN